MLYQSVRSEINYWKVDETTVFKPDRLPVLIGYTNMNKDGIHYYGIPIAEYPGLLKVAHKLVVQIVTVSSSSVVTEINC